MYPVTTLRTMKIAAARSDKLMVFQKITYNPQAPKARNVRAWGRAQRRPRDHSAKTNQALRARNKSIAGTPALSVFRRGWTLILVALLDQAPLPLGRLVPEPWPAVSELEAQAPLLPGLEVPLAA